MNDESVSEEQLTEEQQTVLVQHGLLFQQFLQSEKFVTFINMNYDLIRDEERKEVFVVEVPDSVAAERAMKIMKKQVEDSPRVVSASAAEAKKLLNDPNFLKKAKKSKK